MNLKKIEVRGFKSFADKVEIPLNDGVTAIIGPNGCGKSNVTDAIKWTLGEQSAKSLRGGSMQDVIFAGTEKRKSMSYCEVSLFFDNTNSKIFKSIPFEEVIVTRKLDRGGNSEYLINGTVSRRKDVIGLFRDTGIGKDGYSIIAQGRVQEIMNAKPDERRSIFEEAAGISKSRAQRTESMRKLDRTLTNLNTANEVIAENERQINPLRRQAEVATKFFELKSQLRLEEVNHYIYNFENVQSIKQRINDRIAVLEKDLNLKEWKLNETIAQYDSTRKKFNSIDIVIEDTNSELLTLKVDAERLQGKANVWKEKMQNIKSELERLSADLQSVDTQLLVDDELIKKNEQNLSDALAEYISINTKFENMQTKLFSLESSISDSETDLEAKNLEYVESLKELGDLKTKHTHLIAEKEVLSERQKTMSKSINEKKSALDSEVANLSIYDSNVHRIKEELRDLVAEYNETLSDKVDANEAIIGLNEDFITLKTKLSSGLSHIELLKSVKSQYQGYQDAVKRLMQDTKSDPIIKSKILGVFAEIISVPAEFELAIEYSLGGNMQNVLTETERDASDLITYLKQRNYGRVTFRPLTSARPRSLSSDSRTALGEPGCFGVASDLVKYDARFDSVVRTLLGSTVVVDNSNTAIRLFRKYNQAFKIVTLEGDVFARGGEITGGSRKSHLSGLLSQEKEIELAEINLEKLRKNIDAIEKMRSSREREIQNCERQIAQMSSKISEFRIDAGLNEEKAKSTSEYVEKLKAEIDVEAGQIEEIAFNLKDIQSKLNLIDKHEELVSQKSTEYTQLLAETKAGSGESKNEKQLLNDEVMDLRLKVVQKRNDIDSLKADISRLNREKQRFEEDKLDLIAEIKSVTLQKEAIENAPEKTVFSESDLKKIKSLEAQLSEFSALKKTLSEDIARLDTEKSTLSEERAKLSETKIKNQSMLENVDIEIRQQQEHILEEYDLTYSSALEFKIADYTALGAKSRINETKSAINKLGNVNLNAIDALKELEERRQLLIVQRDDVQLAYNDINSVIEALTAEMTTKFVESFEQIQTNFTSVFKELFGGGKGELVLNYKDTQDPLEAGIDIRCQPPGKNVGHNALLSGGEHVLIAISILFAIMMIKPMPFCILDEVEAALDDANANLFAEFLKKFSQKTQFIVVTHRKPTMRHADSIFGVTMEEKGVTKIVSIEFESAVKHAKEPSAEDIAILDQAASDKID